MGQGNPTAIYPAEKDREFPGSYFGHFLICGQGRRKEMLVK